MPVAAEKVPAVAEKVPDVAEKVSMQDYYKKKKGIYKYEDDEKCSEEHKCDNRDLKEHLEANIRKKKEHFELDETNYLSLKQ